MTAPAHDPDDRPQIDPVTGYETTGHDWGGIKELNTPFPRIVLWPMILAILYSVVAWILLPAWPVGRDYTRGLLGLDQQAEAVAGLRRLDAGREDWMARFAGSGDKAPDLAALAADPQLMARAMPAAHRLFLDNCAACHGTAGGGGPGFPALDDADWLWGGDPATIAQTVTAGINAPDPDTRQAQMPAFDWMPRADRQALAGYVAALPAGKADPASAAGKLFEDNCVACHGEGGAGGLMAGAPSLTDASAIYGQDAATVYATISHGRQGVMPAWSGRLSPEQINLLSVYVAGLARQAEGAGQ